MLTAQTIDGLDELQKQCGDVRLPAIARPILEAGQPIPYRKYSDILHEYGVLVVTLERPDDGETLVRIVNHIGRPHQHDDAGRALWDITQGGTNGAEQLARSHGLNEFVLHTDCSYEKAVPSHFGLYVVEPDRMGGGRNLIIDGLTLIQHLSDKSLVTLQTQPLTLKVPPEFLKEQTHVEACILDEDLHIRYRRELIDLSRTSLAQRQALAEFEELIHNTAVNRGLSLGEGQLLLLDNRRFLHARTEIRDPRRHLKRIRFFIDPVDETRLSRTSIYDSSELAPHSSQAAPKGKNHADANRV